MVFSGVLSIIPISVLKFNFSTEFAAMVTTLFANPGFDGYEISIIPPLSPDEKTKAIGLSPLASSISGAANQNIVST